MLTYGFFNAVYTDGVPDRSYTADDLSEFFDSIIGDGVSADIQDSFKVLAGSGMQVNLNPGYAWIHGYYSKNSSLYPITVSAAPPTDTRIDAVVLRWSRANRNVLPQILTGVASLNPQRPQIVRTADTYDLLLGYIVLNAGDSSITNDMITDTRSDVDVCGIIDTFAARRIPDKSITRAKLADNALYSPIKELTNANYTIDVSDLGKTLCPSSASLSGVACTINIPQVISTQLPVGAEIAIFWQYSSSLTLAFSGNIQTAKAGDTNFTRNTQYSFSDQMSIVAVKKTHTGSGDYWIVQGNVEVI